MQKTHKKTIILVLLSFFCILSMQLACAGFEESLEAYKRGDYAKAFKGFSLLAEQGNATAQCALGAMYQSGFSVEKNPQQAVFWYSKAAEQNHIEAQYALGMAYSYGKGVGIDNQKAIIWFLKS